MDRTQLHAALDTLIDKYAANEYITGRLANYVENLLPASLDHAEKTQNEREKRKQELSSNSDGFIERFLLKNRYYYCSQNELFMVYDGQHFSAHSEDDIQHNILSQITSAEHQLRPWKHKIKNNVIKRIKERSPLQAIPESATIQAVLGMLYPSVVGTRNHAKYFLTVIGDCVAGKNDTALVYIASPLLKEIVREIGVQIYTHFGQSNSLQCVKFKHYDHEYAASRLLFIDDKRKSLPATWEMSKYAIDILCVAAHYSNRYGSADGFLTQCTETALVDHALFLHRNTPDTIVERFIDQCVQQCSGSHIKSKNMIFIWKKFLEKLNVPNVIFHGSLTAMFKNKLNYDEEGDCFKDVTSVLLPVVSSFLQFWDTNMQEDIAEPELEIDEVSSLFKTWAGKGFNGVEDTFLIELIRHFYPEVSIDEEKYIMNMKCGLWDKRQEVVDALELFKVECAEEENNHVYKTLYGAYQHYSGIRKEGCVASKRYFEKIASELLGDLLDEDGFISAAWWGC